MSCTPLQTFHVPKAIQIASQLISYALGNKESVILHCQFSLVLCGSVLSLSLPTF